MSPAPLPPAPSPLQALRAATSDVRAQLRAALRARAAAALARREAAAAELSRHLRATAAERRRLHERQTALQRALLQAERHAGSAFGPFEPTMTMDAAWSRHPRAREVFARRSLPACDRCAVRFDETLEEAASAYGFDLVQLLAELNGLLEAPHRTHPPR